MNPLGLSRGILINNNNKKNHNESLLKFYLNYLRLSDENIISREETRVVKVGHQLNS